MNGIFARITLVGAAIFLGTIPSYAANGWNYFYQGGRVAPEDMEIVPNPNYGLTTYSAPIAPEIARGFVPAQTAPGANIPVIQNPVPQTTPAEQTIADASRSRAIPTQGVPTSNYASGVGGAHFQRVAPARSASTVAPVASATPASFVAVAPKVPVPTPNATPDVAAFELALPDDVADSAAPLQWNEASFPINATALEFAPLPSMKLAEAPAAPTTDDQEIPTASAIVVETKPATPSAARKPVPVLVTSRTQTAQIVAQTEQVQQTGASSSTAPTAILVSSNAVKAPTETKAPNENPVPPTENAASSEKVDLDAASAASPFLAPQPKPKKPVFSGSVVGIWEDGFDHKSLSAFQLHQIWLIAEREVDSKKNALDWGYRFDAVFGTYNGQCTADGGFDGGWGVSGDGYAASFKQAYGQFGYRRFSVKVGKFATPLGVESSNATRNLFNTHTYMYNEEPSSHCGGLFKCQATDKLAFQLGLCTGNRSSFENRRGDKAIVLDATWEASDDLTIRYTSELERIHSRVGEDREVLLKPYYRTLNGASIGDHDEYLHTIIVTKDLNEKWRWRLSTNYGAITDRDEELSRYGLFGVANYLSYKSSKTLTYAGRFEYFRHWLDDAGKCPETFGSVAQNCYDLSFAAIYQPTKAFSLRPEVRYDWTELKGEGDSGFTGSLGCLLTF